MSGILVTFYSFKGGVGRTQALANVAVELANRDHDVVLLDMDLESPGLHTYFRVSDAPDARAATDADLAGADGLIDILTRYVELTPDEAPEVVERLVPLHHPRRTPGAGRLRLLPPGRLDGGYMQRVSTFSWDRFYAELHGYAFMEFVRDTLLSAAGADFVLVDSRTGLTDVGSVCTAQLPDVLVIPFALHRQGIAGTRHITARVAEYTARRGVDARLHKVLLVPSRVEEDGNLDELNAYLDLTQQRLGESFAPLAELRAEIGERIPYHASVAYGEPIVVNGPRETALSKPYTALADRLLALRRGVAPEDAHDAQHAPTPSPPARLRDAGTRLIELAARLTEACAGPIGALSAGDLLRRADRIARIESELVRSWRRTVDDLATLADASASDMPPPETLADWSAAVDALVDTIDGALSRWRARRREEARARLLEATGGDRGVARKPLDALDAFLADEPEDAALDAWLAEHEAALAGQRADDLLDRGELTADALEGWYPEGEARRSWLLDRISELQQRGARAEGDEARLHNLLALVAPLVPAPDAQLWGAYDTLCAWCFAGDEAPTLDEPVVFDAIASGWWVAHWRAAFAQRVFDRPPVVHALDQLGRLDEQAPERLAPVVEAIAEALGQARLTPEDIDALFERNKGDPLLRRALHRLPIDSPATASLLATWLMRVGCAADWQGTERLLEVLLCDGRISEAMRLLQIVAHDAPALAERPVARRATLTALLHGGLYGLRPLRQETVVRWLASEPIGTAVVLGAAGRLFDAPWRDEAAETLAHTVTLHGQALRRPLTDVEAAWLRWLEIHREPPLMANAIADALDDARSAAHSPSIYASWTGSAYIEQPFRDHWDQHIEAILDARDGQTEPVDAVGRLDADGWIRETVSDLRARGRKLKIPEDTALTNLRTSFESARMAVMALADLRPPGLSLRQALQAHGMWLRYRRAVVDSLTAATAVDPLAARLVERLGGTP